jgi:photosystem II stability/assembly factor-like uncharacterized protein
MIAKENNPTRHSEVVMVDDCLSFLRCYLARLAMVFVLLAAGDNAQGAIQPDRWRWSNPAPHGNNVLDMYCSEGLAVQVGDAGSVYVQWDGGRWAPAATGVTNYLRGVTLMGSRLIVVGENGCILWSDDGKKFQKAQLTPATANWFEGVTCSSQRAVAVGDYGTIYTSTNGTNWAPISSSPTAEWLRGVTFGDGVFVAVGEYGTILRSMGGTSWSKIAVSTTVDLNRVRYLGTGGRAQFVAAGNGGVVLSSTTGNTGWAAVSTGSTNNLYDAAMNDTGLLLVGDQEVRFRPAGTTTFTNQITDLPTNAAPAWTYLCAYGVSNYFLAAGRTGYLVQGSLTNGAAHYDWQSLSISSHAWLWDLVIQNGLYVAVGDLATILTSLDGVLWAREVVPVSTTNTVLLGVGGNTNALLAVGNGGMVLASYANWTNMPFTNVVGTNIIVTNASFNTMGLIWSSLPSFTTNNLQGIAATSNLFVVAGQNGCVFSSTNAALWKSCASPSTNFLSGVTAFPNGWIAVGDRGTLLRSSDANAWTAVSLGTTNWLYRVRWVGNQLVVVGQNGTVYTSADGTNWTSRSSGVVNRLNDVTWLDGTWYVAGNQGLMLASTNLVNWSPVRIPTIKSLFGAGVAGGQLVTVGIEGVVLRNPVVPLASPVAMLGYDYSVGTNAVSDGTNTVAVPTAYELFLFGGETDQFFEFQSSTNLSAGWSTNSSMELFDPSGTLYLLRTRDLTNASPQEYYRTRLLQ